MSHHPSTLADFTRRLVGVTFRARQLENAAVGLADIYTCPSGKRAMAFGLNAFNATGLTVTYYTAVKIGGTSYRNSSTVSIGSGGATNALGGNAAGNLAWIMEPGEVLQLNVLTNGGASFFWKIIEFDITNPVFTARLLTMSLNGTGTPNLLYTCPPGKQARVLPSALNGLTAGSLYGYNGSAGTIVWQVSMCPSGGTPGAAVTLLQNNNIGATARATFSMAYGMQPGDALYVGVASDAATFTAWANIAEFAL